MGHWSPVLHIPSKEKLNRRINSRPCETLLLAGAVCSVRGGGCSEPGPHPDCGGPIPTTCGLCRGVYKDSHSGRTQHFQIPSSLRKAVQYMCLYFCKYGCMDVWMDEYMYACMYVCISK